MHRLQIVVTATFVLSCQLSVICAGDEKQRAIQKSADTTSNGDLHHIARNSTPATQPTGALSGVVVYCNAGHGWTGGPSGWNLQRPVLLEMCEDYGNIDQLNLLAEYLFRAGATVVPFRPVGWQPLEIVLDQDDPGVTSTGTWSSAFATPYYENGVTNSGVAYVVASASASETATYRYTPSIVVTDYYPVYTWVVPGGDRAVQTYRIAHSGGTSDVKVDHRETGNGWIYLGTYYLESGGTSYVEITNESAAGSIVIADAIRWGCGVGDVAPSGGGPVSQYPRDEETVFYWGASELGNNSVGYNPNVWSPTGVDRTDTVACGARWAALMNVVPNGGVQVDRHKRCYLEVHSNAGGGRGLFTLINSPANATTNQLNFATILSEEFDDDLNEVSSQFEHAWFDRPVNVLDRSDIDFSAISTSNNDNEFDATQIEVAFHDNAQDNALLRDPAFRTVAARAMVHGIIRFLNQLPNSTIPLAFPPDTPRDVAIKDLGADQIEISWDAPTASGASGDSATGYVIHQSNNGFGFGNPIAVGNITSVVLGGIPVQETLYFRVAAVNAGGHSPPSEVLAIRKPPNGPANILIVNGFDRLDRILNETTDIIQGFNNGSSVERQIPRISNSFDYVVQYAEALAINNYAFVTSSDEAVGNGGTNLDDYDVVLWALGNEGGQPWLSSAAPTTLQSSEQTAIATYLDNGGSLFINGSNLAYELIGLNKSVAFVQNMLATDFVADNAESFDLVGVSGSILADAPPFDFDPSLGGSVYRSLPADVLIALGDATPCLNYSTGRGGVAGVQNPGPGRTVAFGFPWETIRSDSIRAQILNDILQYLLPLPFDVNGDGDIDQEDTQNYLTWMTGPGNMYPDGSPALLSDGDRDGDVDLHDGYLLQQLYTGPL
jgi:hypothetical protein